MTKIFILLLITALPVLAVDVTVTIDADSKVLTSTFHIGTTHTHGFWEYGHASAMNRAKTLLMEGVTLQNQHIMGWGAGNPNPQPGVFQWNDLDHRVDLMRSIDTPMCITFCQAPGWMKGEDDWAMEQEVLDEYVDDFAELCMRVADRYKDVEYFQIWNEMKGYWSSSLNNWDYIRYTTLYNAVYTAVKEARPDAKLGGPYIVIQGDGAVRIGKSGRDTHVPIDSRDKKVLSYWLENKVGADFVCMDYALIDYHDPNTYTHDEKMQLTRMFGEWISDVRDMTDLPIVISEFYAGADAADWEFTAANYASCFYHALMNGASMALQWNPEQGELESFLFTDTEKSDGGQPTPLYFVIKAINDNFSAGVEIVTATSSSEWVDVLASKSKTMLINKKDESVTVSVNGLAVDLKRYEVKVIDTPAGTGVEEKSDIKETSAVETRCTPYGAEISITPIRSTDATIRVYNLLGQSVHEFSLPLSAHVENIVQIEKTARLARGAYFVHVNGLERPFVKQIQLP